MKNIIRRIIDEFREFPASTTLGVAWIAVFVLMLGDYLYNTPHPSFKQILYGNFTPAHRYGDLTAYELFHGEIWRAITCTFVHYNLLHIGLNLYGLYQLGGLVEEWYGSWLFVTIYALIGGGGNILSALFRRALGLNLMMHSGGGSTVVLGLVALAAVVGWRMKTRNGDYLRSQMVGILGFTAFLGVVLPIIDNWGHAGGAIMGALIGLGHQPLLRLMKGLVAPVTGILAGLILVSSGIAQVRDNRVEDRIQAKILAAQRQLEAADQTVRILAQVEFYYSQVVRLRAMAVSNGKARSSAIDGPGPYRRPKMGWPYLNIADPNFGRNDAVELPRHLEMLDSTKSKLAGPPTEADFKRVRELVAHLFDRPVTNDTWREFRNRWSNLLKKAVAQAMQARLSIEALTRTQKLN
ncbi:rhomboid family intramembrane serine protease [Singulisphaera sp. PoT]|uniref:rhomboid family intramembrane serine protease n=1 Tax=Singulisphaera sp. PoT TaxID=3411797 RepID=UPI003BF4A0CD